jgi:DnaJ-domain-containing protein 1
VSIGKRLIDLARSELNSLLDRAAQLDDDGDRDRSSGAQGSDEMGEPPREATSSPPRPRARSGKVRLEDLSDAELEAEIERRRLDRELEERARRNANARTASGAYRAATGAYGGGGSGSPRGAGSRAGARPWSVPGDPVTKAYAALEVPPGSNFETVRKAYRNLMRKYHPDRHTASPEKQKAANELAQKLTASYEILEKHLRP